MKILEVKTFSSVTKKFVGKNLTLRFAEKLQEVEAPMIACLKGYHKDTKDKLADIKMDRLRTRQSTSVVDHNMAQYDRLPESVKKALKPSDVYRDGHINQSRVNEIWDAAKDSGKAGVYGRPPFFRGAPDELDPQAIESVTSFDAGVDIDTDIIENLSDSFEMIDSADGAASSIEAIGDIIDILG